jgi:ketosteroid isomerase-like protein
MKTILLTLVMVAGLATAGFGGSADAELKTIEEKWLDAYMKSDASFLKNLEAEDYMIIEPEGVVGTKSDDVKSVTDKKFVLKSATMSEFKCRMIGENVAIVTAMLKMSGSDNGKEFSGDFRGMDVFEKKDGKWMAVASQLTKVEKEK